MAATGSDGVVGAPPIYYCKRCKAKAVNVLTCVTCNSHFHKSCAKNQGNVKFMSDNNIDCCNSVTDVIQDGVNDI